MNIIDILCLILAILSGSIALTLMIGGVIAFQNIDFSEKRKMHFLELADGLIFSSFFTTIYRVFENWDKNRDGRQYIYGSILFTTIAVSLLFIMKIQ